MVLNGTAQDAADIDPKLLKDYQGLVGALLYCAVNTRPDVAYSVSLLCRAMGKPTQELYEQALRVLYYLHHTAHIGLLYEADEFNPDLSGMSDSDWAVKHSTTGFIFSYARAAISWGCKKQTSIALSSCEAEIMALSEAAKEAVYLDRFLTDLELPNSGTMKLATDNSAARDLAYNPEHHEKTKHIERRHFYVRELVENNTLVVPYVSTHENLADFFTKPLAGDAFYSARNKTMNIPKGDTRALKRSNAATAARASAGSTCPACGHGSAPARRSCLVDPDATSRPKFDISDDKVEHAYKQAAGGEWPRHVAFNTDHCPERLLPRQRWRRSAGGCREPVVASPRDTRGSG